MRVIKARTGYNAEIVDMENTLEAFQQAVGGYIETVNLNGDEVIVCNEDGINLKLPINRTLVFKTFAGNVYNVPILGDFVICGTDGEDFCELELERAKELCEQFRSTRVYVR